MRSSLLSHPLSTDARRASPSAFAALVVIAACGDPQPPSVCGTLDDLTMHVHDDDFIEPCFEDPEMGRISLSAESSHPEVVTAEVVGYGVAIRAIYTGDATVTVTATDPDLLSASASFAVHVPNRPPWRRGRIPHVHLFPRNISVRQLSLYFTDPDNQLLSYTAASSDTTVVSTHLQGDVATLQARGEGSAMLTVTAADPYGETVSQETTVTVTAPTDMLREDFETDAIFSDWELNSASDATVTEDGRLRLYNVVAGLLGWIETEVAAAPWEASASMGNTTDSVFVGIAAVVDHPRYNTYLIQVGRDDELFTDFGTTDYRFLVWDKEYREWNYLDNWYGVSDEVAAVGGLTEVVLAVQGGNLTVRVGSELVLRLDLESMGLSDELTHLAFASWAKCCRTGQAAIVDWVELRGVPLDGGSMGGSGADGGLAGRLPGTGLRKAILSGTVKRLDRAGQVSRASGRRE